MGEFSERDVEDVLGGVQPPGRDDLAPVVELTTWLHASREIEPAPAMRDDLFCQIEDGFGVYQRSSRRPPAHMRRRAGMRLSVRRTLAGARRPIASVAAAVVLLVGVILAVRGGPAREPSAYVSPSARGVSASGAGTPSSSTTPASTTTSAPDAAPGPDAAATTVPQGDASPTRHAVTKVAPFADVTPPDPRPGDDTETAPPTYEEKRREVVGGDPARSEQASTTDRLAPPPAADADDEMTAWDMSLSGWDFDLSEGFWATDLWAALQEAERKGDAVYRQDGGPADDDWSGDRHEDRATGSHRDPGEERDRRADDREQEGGRNRY